LYDLEKNLNAMVFLSTSQSWNEDKQGAGWMPLKGKSIKAQKDF
jgi:hypothetical protein